jgi:phage-related protein
VVFVGDAASLIRAAEQAKLATAGAAASIEASSKKVGAGYFAMTGAARKSAEEIEHSTGRIGSALSSIATSGNLGIAAIVGVGAAIEGVKKSTDTLEELTKTTLTLTHATGLSSKSASTYAAIAKVQGISATGLQQAFGTLSKSVQAVTNVHDGLTKSAKTQEAAFKQLGIPVKTLLADHKNMNLILPQVVDRFEKMRGSTEKASLGMTLFGRGWKTLVPLLHEGALGLKEQEAEAKAMGLTLGGNAAQNAIKLQQAQDKLKYAMLGVQVAIAEKVAPALTSAIATFSEFVKEIRTGSGSAGHAFHTIGQVFQTTAQIIGPIVKVIEGVVGGMATSIEGAVHLIKGAMTLNFSEAWDGVKHIFSGGVKAVEAILQDAIAPFKKIGEEMLKGLVHGLEAGASAVTNVAKKIAKLPGDAIHEVLGIKSPSTVMHVYGKYTAEGFAGGFLAGSKAIEDALQRGLLAPVTAAAHVASRSSSRALGGKLTKSQLEQLWIEAGGSPNTANIAASVALAESGGRVSAAGDVGLGGSGPTSFGLWQIHTPAHPQYSSSRLASDPLYNARAAVAVAEGGRNFEPWSTFKSGAYRQFLSQVASGGAAIHAGGVAFAEAAKKAAHLVLSAAQQRLVGRQTAAVQTWHAAAEGFATDATELGSALQRGEARWAAMPADISTRTGAATKLALKALQKEARAWAKLRDSYRRFARHAKNGHVKKEAIDKAAEYEAKIEQAQTAAKELKGTIYAAETEIIEAESQVAKDPGEAQLAQTGADLSAYQAANAKVDAEVRAGLITEAQGKAAKEANANKALSGGYGALSEEGILQVKGDLREFSQTVQEANSELERHNELLAEANKLLKEQLQASERIAQVEVGTLTKAVADMVSGQIAGIGYAGRQMTAGAGSAARY